MKVGITNLTKKDIEFYKWHCEKYNVYDFNKQKTIHKITIGDVVQIKSELYHDSGYENQTGIVSGLSGVNNYCYVHAYCTKSNRYWSCGFPESELILLDQEIDFNSNLFREYEDYLLRNAFNLCGEDFIEEYKNYMKSYKYHPKFIDNVFYVDFKTKQLQHL
jgi:hypothetical protein